MYLINNNELAIKKGRLVKVPDTWQFLGYFIQITRKKKKEIYKYLNNMKDSTKSDAELYIWQLQYSIEIYYYS